MATLSVSRTIGDGQPSIKVTGSATVDWSVPKNGTSNPSAVWKNWNVKMKVTKKDGLANGDPYMKVTQVSRNVIGLTDNGALIEKNPIGKTYVAEKDKEASFYCTVAQFSNSGVQTLNAAPYFRTAGSSYTPLFRVFTTFWRERFGIKFSENSHTTDTSSTMSIPNLCRFYRYGNSGSSFSTAMDYIRITNWMYKLQGSGTYAGWPGTTYGTRTINLEVPVTVNFGGTLSVVFTGKSGTNTSGHQVSISKSLSAGTSGVVSLSGTKYFRNGPYYVNLTYTDGFSSANVPTISCTNPGFSSSSGGVYFYAPGDSYSPPNSAPSFSISNTTSQQVSTNQTKNVSLRITLNDNGVSKYWLNKMVYNVDLYWNDGTKIGSYTVNDSDMNNLSAHNTNFSTTVQIRSSMRQKDEYVYWVVSGYSVDTAGKTRWGTTRTSGKVNLFWAYNEPAKVSFNSARISSSSGPNFSNNKAQLYYGGTTLNFVLQATINAWGDRPGTRTYEFSLNRNGSVVKWYGRNTTSDTGTKSHTYSYTVPDNWVGLSANFTVYKRLGDTEYLASGDPKNPALGTNHASGGTISFYEVIGGVSGMIDIKPSILMVSIPCSVSGTGYYDKQSSQKVRYYVEVFDIDADRVVNQYVLGNTSGDITKEIAIDLSSSDFTVSEAHLYELRLKADVTELLGNVHTYTFYTTTRQSFMPPQYTLTQTTDELLPPVSDTSLLIRQKATNTYTYKVDYDLALSTSILYIEYYLASSPNVKRTKTVNVLPAGYAGGTFYGQYTFPNPKDLDPSDPMYDPEGFALGTKVTAWVSSTWNLPGSTSVYSNSSGKVQYNVTPTRYIYFLTRGIENEQWLNTVHSVTPTRADKKSKKIFVETDIS